jgi:hypothetical protein
MIRLRREIAKAAGFTYWRFTHEARLSFGKVAEYQARGVVHFHAIFRLDGIDPADPNRIVPPPVWATTKLLETAVRAAAGRVAIAHPLVDRAQGGDCIRWGEQLDVHAITAAADEHELSDQAVAGYLAKYVTKGAEDAGTVDTTIACRSCRGLGVVRSDDNTSPGKRCLACHGEGARLALDDLRLADHPLAMIRTAWELGGRVELAALNLRLWAHMLGFPGHCATKSRRYSTTLTALRNARRDHKTANLLTARGIDPDTPIHRVSVGGAVTTDDETDVDGLDPDTVLVLSHWQYAGRGHGPGQAILADLIAQDMHENRRIARAAIRQQKGEEVP